MNVQTKHYVKELLNIALPIIMGNLGFILIAAGDVLIAGRHSTDTLAAISIAAAISNCIMTFGIGLIASVSPLLSNFRGAKKPAKRYLFPTIRFAMCLAAITAAILLAFVPVIDLMGFEYKLVPDIKNYMMITAFATFGGYLHAALKEYLQAFEIVLFPNLLTIFCIFLNLILNCIFVFGFGIIPSMGVTGLAIASFMVRYIMGFTLLIYCFKIMSCRNYHEKNYYKKLIQIGLPISFAVLVEFIAFNSIAIFMGRVSGIYAAAQNLVCTLTTVSFMVPLAISNAIAVKVGFANGAKQYIDLKNYSQIGILISVGFMSCSALIFCGFPEFLAGLFTKDTALMEICIPILYILALFQIFDGLQVALSGIYKGIKKTKIVLAANILGYWVISVPLGYWLAFHKNYNLLGFWYGLFCAAVILCSFMLIMLFKYFAKLKTEFASAASAAK